MISKTPKPPYYAVIFTSMRSENTRGYDETSNRMIALAKKQKGFLGIESARKEVGITVSYWNSLENIKKWKNVFEHKIAQKKGKEVWYNAYKVRICKVEHEYGFEKQKEFKMYKS
jgi:heme-degrading monooxygenase HmoA